MVQVFSMWTLMGASRGAFQHLACGHSWEGQKARRGTGDGDTDIMMKKMMQKEERMPMMAVLQRVPVGIVGGIIAAIVMVMAVMEMVLRMHTQSLILETEREDTEKGVRSQTISIPESTMLVALY